MLKIDTDTRAKIINQYKAARITGFITKNDIIFGTGTISYFSLKEDKLISQWSRTPIYFHKKYRSHRNCGVRWFISDYIDPIYIYPPHRGTEETLASEIIRDYTKLQDEVRMIGFWITDLRINY